jgi:hypothetical protein
MTDLLRIGHLELRLPPRLKVRLQSNAADADAVKAFVLASPDHTVYHHEPYFEYARRDDAGGPGELALFLHDGNPVFAIPLHVRRPNRVVTGYSGILFSPGEGELALRRSVRSLAAFLEANARLSFEAMQSAQAAAYSSPQRHTVIRRFLAELDLETRPIFTRVLKFEGAPSLEESPGAFPGSVAVTPQSLDNAQLASYDGDARNQIRQALRGGLLIDAFSGARRGGTGSAYELIQPLHEATWSRSSWTPHPLEYWLSLSAAVNEPEGASDLIVVVSDAERSPIAGVVCHRHQGRALYWSGCSRDGAGATRANPLCLHAAISICGATGTELFEIGRFDAREQSAKERAVTQYKSQFRGELLEVVNFVRSTARARAALYASRLRDRTGALVQRAHSRDERVSRGGGSAGRPRSA